MKFHQRRQSVLDAVNFPNEHPATRQARYSAGAVSRLEHELFLTQARLDAAKRQLARDLLHMQAVGAGTLRLPMGDFPVVALQGQTDKLFALTTTTYRSMAFVAECYGVVAKADAQPNEPEPMFAVAAELRFLEP